MPDEFDPSSFTPGAPTGAVPAFASKLPEGAQAFIRSFSPADDDTGVVAMFEKVPTFQTFKSREATEKAGKPVEIWEDVVFIRINVRGSHEREVHRPIRDEDKRRFPFAWQEFQNGQKQHAERGTQLSMLGMDAPTCRQMQARNVFIIEDLALVNDIHLQNLGAGAREWRHKAREFVAARAPKVAHTDQIDQLQAQLTKAMELIEKQGEMLKEQAEKRGPGRPRKDTEAA